MIVKDRKRGCADWIEDLAVDGECLGRSRGGLTTKLHLAVDRWGQAATLRVLGQLHRADGRLDLAQDYLDGAISIWVTMETPL